MKAVLRSIQPYYVFLIIARALGYDIKQRKVVEVGKNKPQASDWNKKVFIYCSKNKKSFMRIPPQHRCWMEPLLGKVIGEFICDRIYPIWGEWIDEKTKTHQVHLYREINERRTCLTEKELNDYLIHSGGYGWHISDLKIYDKPKELSEFFAKGECNAEICEKCSNYHEGRGWLDGSYYDENCCNNSSIKPITRPPQSWCYVHSRLLYPFDPN